MAEQNEQQPSVAVAQPAAKPKPYERHKTKQLPPYNVVLLDDDDHRGRVTGELSPRSVQKRRRYAGTHILRLRSGRSSVRYAAA